MSSQAQRTRSRVSCGRIAGTVQSWEGQQGWITPKAKVNHPLSNKNGGRIFVKKSDVSAGQELTPGAAVDFLVYSETAEGGRLGAEFCRKLPAGHMPATAKAVPAVKAPVAKMAAKKPILAAGKGAPKGAATVPKKLVIPTITKTKAPQPAAAPAMSQVQAAHGAQKWMEPSAKARAAQKGGGAVQPPKQAALSTGNAKETPPGPENKAFPARTLIGNVRHKGVVSKWLGKFGWIKPDQLVNHPAASKRKGDLYLNSVDVQRGQEVKIGSQVDFLIYVDSSGLGAESCRVLPGDGGALSAKGGAKGGKGKAAAAAATPQNSSKGSGKGVTKSITKVMTPKPKAVAAQGALQQGLLKKGSGKGGKGDKGDKGKKQPGDAEKSLPPFWEEHYSDEYGVPYYWNSKSKESAWIKPTK